MPQGRPAPLAQGTLDKRPVSHLLAYVYERRLSGSLVFGDPDASVGAIVVREGAPIKADVPGAFDAYLSLADLPGPTAFAYFDSFDALEGVGEVPLHPLTAIARVLRRRPPVELMRSMFERVGTRELSVAADAVKDALGLGVLQVEALAAMCQGPFTLDALRANRVLAGEADTVAYAVLITKVAQVLAPSTQKPSLPPPRDSSADLGAPPSTPSSSADVASAPVGRMRLSRTAIPKLTEERAVISTRDDRASMTPPGFPAVLSPALEERRREITERAAKIDRENYFEMLGLPQTAGGEEAQNAYLVLAKRWHPDRLPPELAAVREACARVFARLSEAASTLRDDEQRKRYELLLKEGGATPEDQEKIASVLEAATAFQKAEVMMKRGDIAKAHEFAALAVRLDSQPDYIAIHTWLEAMKPENQSPEQVRSLIDVLTKCVTESVRCERAFFYRGTLRKRIGDPGAMDDFRIAFELNPRNLDAQREVRVHTMRAQKEAQSQHDIEVRKKSGLFDRLFKK